jgi:TRAP-type transport system periplasmic protein
MKNQILKPAIFIILGLFMVSAFLAGACGPSTTTSSTTTSISPAVTTGVIKLKMGTGWAATDIREDVNRQWIDKIQRETNGRVQIILYSSGTLIDQFGSYDELLAGVADITNIAPAAPGTPFPIARATDSFFYGATSGSTRKILNKLWETFPEMPAEFASIKLLYSIGQTEVYYHTKNKAIRTLDDFKGLQLMAPIGYSDLLAKLGATGSMIPNSELYNSLEKGILDGVPFQAGSLKEMALDEITKYSTNTHLIGAPSSFYVMNLGVWNHLPPDIQKIFEDSIPWANDQLDQVISTSDKKAIEQAKAKGHEFIEFSPSDQTKFYSLLDEIATAKVKELDAQGLAGTQIFQETRRLVQEYSK